MFFPCFPSPAPSSSFLPLYTPNFMSSPSLKHKNNKIGIKQTTKDAKTKQKAAKKPWGLFCVGQVLPGWGLHWRVVYTQWDSFREIWFFPLPAFINCRYLLGSWWDHISTSPLCAGISSGWTRVGLVLAATVWGFICVSVALCLGFAVALMSPSTSGY